MPLTGCSILGTDKPPATEIVIERASIPASLFVLPSLPPIPPKPRTDTQIARWAIAMEAWAGTCSGQLATIRDLVSESAPVLPDQE